MKVTNSGNPHLEVRVETAAVSMSRQRHEKSAEAVKQPHLLSSSLDVLMIGGASLVMFGFAWLMIDKGASTNQISWAAFYLAFVINNPHFMASYALLYWDKRRELLSNKSFLWAGVVAPGLILAYMLGSIFADSPRYLSYAVNVMFFTVGWHYVKQIYGTIVVTSARRGYYFTKQEAWTLKLTLYPVWFMSFINGNLGVREIMHYGVGYKTFDIPTWTRDFNFGLVAVSLVALTVVLVRKYWREGKVPGWPALVSFAAIYIWYLPSLYHAHFWYLIPFFHSLQYMLFVFAMKRNQYSAESKAESAGDPVRQRFLFSRNFFGFLAIIGVTAYLSFNFVPRFLDANLAYDKKLFGNELFMFMFITFINIHHYFIDNVIWRRDNPALKQHLF